MFNLRPGVRDISFSLDWYLGLHSVDPVLFTIVMRLTAHLAAKCVWTMTEPREPEEVDDDERLARVSGVGLDQFKGRKKELGEFFQFKDGRIRPKTDWFKVDAGGVARPILPASLRMKILVRDKFTCGYCGEKSGPFDIDHIVPISRGGSSLHPDNLICSCAPCNRSKSDQLPCEWLR